MSGPRYPSLYQVNTRVRLSELATALGRPATLDDITDAELDALAREMASTSSGSSASGRRARRRGASRVEPRVARRVPARAPRLRRRGRRAAPASRSATTTSTRTSAATRRSPDCASGCGSRPAPRPRLRPQPRGAGPSAGSPSTRSSSSRRTEEQLAAQPRNYCRVETAAGPSRSSPTGAIPTSRAGPTRCSSTTATPALQEAMLGELGRIAGQCDGVRCDMAMLVLPDVFERTWGIAAPRRSGPGPRRPYARRSPGSCSWPRSTGTSSGRSSSRASTTPTTSGSTTAWTRARRTSRPRAPARRPRLPGPPRALPREPRRATGRRHVRAGGPPGRRHPHLPHARPALLPPGPARGEAGADPRCTSAADRSSPSSRGSRAFYDRLLECLKDPAFRDGDWQLLDAAVRRGTGNGTSDAFVAFVLDGARRSPSPRRRQLRPSPGPVLRDAAVERPRGAGPGAFATSWGRRLRPRGRRPRRTGLYLDMPAWGHHVFAVSPLPVAGAVTNFSADGHDAAAEPVAVAMSRA